MPELTDSHPRERDVFLDASEIADEPARSVFLDETCGGDAHLRARVETLLGIEERPGLLEPEPDARPVIDEIRAVAGVGNGNPSGTATGPRGWQPPAPETLDSLFEAYDIHELIGRGGMGAVYRATQLSMQRSVAIKILPPESGEDPAFAKRFHREALAMAKLDHPNIVKVHHFGSVTDDTGDEQFYIVMEYVEGADLHRLIAGGGLDPATALDVVGQVCDALQYAHDRGYVHRDIKPANIYLSPEGKVKVGDFGLAKLALEEGDQSLLTQLTMEGFRIGTPHYMAPETLVGTGVDHRADIYSLGVMFYEMLTGTVPKGVFAPPSEKVPVDARLDAVVLRAMAEKPDERYQQVREVKAAVTTVIEQTEAAPQSTGKKPVAGAKSPTRTRWLKAAITILLAVGLGYWAGNHFHRGESGSPLKQVAPVVAGEPDFEGSWPVVMVSTLEDGDAIPGSLRRALRLVEPGGVVRLDAALAGQTIELAGRPLVPAHSISIDAGALEFPMKISAGTSSRVLEVAEDLVVSLANVEIVGGRSDAEGGGILNRGDLTLVDCHVKDCRSQQSGGGIANLGGTLRLEHCAIWSNRAEAGNGGGIFNHGGRLEIEACLFEENRTEADGGGIHNGEGGEFRIANSLFNKNEANGSGGGLSTDQGGGEQKLLNCGFQGCASSRRGGAIAHAGAADLVLINAVIRTSKAPAETGGAIDTAGPGTVELIHGTISENAPIGIRAGGNAKMLLDSSIVANTEDGGPDVAITGPARLVTRSANIVEKWEGPLLSGPEPLIVNPRLSISQTFGSPIPTPLLPKDSSAVDAAVAGEFTPPTDLRGLPRTDGNDDGEARPDLGAYEWQPDRPDGDVVVVTSTRDDFGREGTLRHAIATARGATIRFDSSLSGKTIRLRIRSLNSTSVTIDGSGLEKPVTILPPSGDRIFIFSSRRTIRLVNLRIGGGIATSCDLTLDNCLVENGDYRILEVRRGGRLVLNRCVIANNRASISRSGGVDNSGGFVRFENCIVVNNSGGSSPGTGLSNHSGGTMELIHCTVMKNPLGGIWSDATSTLVLDSCIVTENGKSHGDVHIESGGIFLTRGVNLIGNVRGELQSGEPPLGVAPNLAPFGDHGGGLPSMPPLPGSPAIDAATAGEKTPETDLRGFPRPADGDGDGEAAPDLGATEKTLL